jgi:NTP pyrophosphatase (non-canonical NTP hydrolase)
MGENFVYPTLGLSGEAGEVAEKIKKVIRDKEGKIDNETREMIRKELGDVMWYVAQLATELDLTLDEIASANIEKLASRLERGKIGGSGDDR